MLQGWGFIIQEAGGPNLFFHSNAMEETNASIEVGSRVTYESIFDAKRGIRKAQCVALAPSCDKASDRLGFCRCNLFV